ncbi:unnamed protein product [Cylindrotheca closterium]|uniref:Uncharacterized protein n=1 Tax=Cylindrotheca closterium TaxID=2856 RepID=A0AAD2JMM8_9STRA|nr:unnamed protein product [Cylindrotheca closterium]
MNQGPAPPDVIILGGWSPGPLLYLKDFLASNQCRIVELQIPMPPIPGSWCLDKAVCGTIGILILMIFGLALHASDLHWFLFAFIVFPIWFRILAVIVVRVSIKQGIQIALQAIRESEGRETILVGFSWGAAVLGEMVALGMIGRSDQPLALLIAPTSSLVASVAKQRDAALRIRHSCNSNRVFVVHGTADHTFCPNQERWQDTGASLHYLVDNHVFMRHPSQRQLINIAGSILRSTESQAF